MNILFNIFSIILTITAASVLTENSTDEENGILHDKEVESQTKPPTRRVVSSRIYRGSDITTAIQHDLKHQVLIETVKEEGVLSCGGTLLSNLVVLTAGHCLAEGKNATIYFGLRNQNDKLSAQQQIVSSTQWKIHNNYDNVKIVNDLAIIILNKDIEFSNIVGKAYLPPATMDCTDFTGSTVIISGWGINNDKEDSPSPSILQYAKIKVAPKETCQDTFPGSFKSDTMLCSDGTNAGTCVGDSGGPMTWNNEGKETVIGASSFSTPRCATSDPRVFTCVSAFVGWITDIAGKNL